MGREGVVPLMLGVLTSLERDYSDGERRTCPCPGWWVGLRSRERLIQDPEECWVTTCRRGRAEFSGLGHKNRSKAALRWQARPPPLIFRGERLTPLKLLFPSSQFSVSYWKPPSKRRPTLKDKGARQNLGAGQIPRHDTSMAWQRRRPKEEETPEREILHCSSSALIRESTIALPNPN